MSEPKSDRELGVMERQLERITTDYIPYVLLALSILLDLLAGSAPLRQKLVTIGLAGVAALWLLSRHLLPAAWTGRQAWKSVYIVGLLVIIAALITMSSLYGFFAWSAYFSTWAMLPGRWRLAGVSAAALLHISTIFGGPQVVLRLSPASAIAFVLVVAMVVVLVLIGSRLADLTAQRSEQRRRAVGELAEANRKLEELLRENAGLHAQLLAQAREAGVLDERQRMAMEIHDTLAQGLTGIITQA